MGSIRARAKHLMATWRVRGSLAVIGVLVLTAIVGQAVPETSPAGMLMRGARTALVAGLGGAALSMTAAIGIGSLAAVRGGTCELVMARAIEVLGAFPSIAFVALARAVERQPSLGSLVLVLALVRFPESARLVRAEIMRLRGTEFVIAARAIGASPLRMVVRHVGPHAAATLAHSTALGCSILILLESALAFLGWSAPGSTLSWGSMVVRALQSDRPAGALLPAASIMLTVVALLMLADGVRDMLDPFRSNANPLRKSANGST